MTYFMSHQKVRKIIHTSSDSSISYDWKTMTNSVLKYFVVNLSFFFLIKGKRWKMGWVWEKNEQN